jgi:leader peptidase (prepilin peptidase)/N-methyltransferase
VKELLFEDMELHSSTYLVKLSAGGWQGWTLSAIILILGFLIGVTIFSYLNVVIEELPKEEEEERLTTRLLKAGGKCPYCGHQWKVKESLPVVSWFLYRHKCMYCFEPLSFRHTAIELLGGALSVVTVLYYGVSFAALQVFLVFCVLTVITLIDWDTCYIPNCCNVVLAVLGVLSIWTLPGTSVVERLVGAVFLSLLLVCVRLIVPGSFGMGDVKLVAAAGLLLGWKGNVAAFFVALVTGGIYACYLLCAKEKKKEEQFAFGPFLCLGIAVSLYGGMGARAVSRCIGMVIQLREFM